MVNKPYMMDPENVKFDTRFSTFNTEKKVEEFDALYRQIELDTQQDPILIKDGLCGDGIHRVKVAKLLNRQVLAVDVCSTISDKEYIRLCNKNTFTARNDSSTVKAIKAYQLTTEFGYSDAEARAEVGLSDRRLIGYVRFIQSSSKDGELGILDKLSRDTKVQIDGTWTKSIDTAKRLLTKLEEKEALTTNGLLDRLSKDLGVDYNELLLTEIARERFWKYNTQMNTTEMKLEYIKMLNEVFKID